MRYRCLQCGMLSGELADAGSPAAMPADPIERLATAKAEMDKHLAEVGHLARIRREAMAEVVAVHGPTKAAEILGVTRAAVYKLLDKK